MNRRAMSLVVAACIVLPGAAALAFPFGYSWHDRADGSQSNGGRAGAGGIYGMGSATDYFITCANCHVNGKGQIGVTITPTPAWAKVNNLDAYKPGQKYTITVAMTGEHLGLNQNMDNLNGFALTVEDQGGKVKGVFTSDTNPPVSSAACPKTYPKPDPATGTTYTYGDCHGVIFIPRVNTTQWTFSWTAPAAGSGQLTLYYGVVDGDHQGKSSLDDDVKMGTIKLGEGS
jgi:hypothetical protein